MNIGGRPRKGTLEEKKAIVDHYFVTRCAENVDAIKIRGIYRNLAYFAQELGYDYAEQHFRRDQEIRDYINSYAEAEAKVLPQDILPVFVPLDLSLIREWSRDEIAEMLRDRDRYYESLYTAANATIQPFRNKVLAYEKLQEELRAQRSKNGQLSEENNTLAESLRYAKEEIAYLHNYIKRHVLPEQAEAVLLASKDPKSAVRQSTPFVTSSLNQQTYGDRVLRMNVEEDNYVDFF